MTTIKELLPAAVTLVSVRATFETAHRLPHLPGKCQSLHGHSWAAHATIAGDPSADTGPRDVVADFGYLKSVLRDFTDRLDHGTMLGAADPLIAPLRDAGCKVFVVGADEHSGGLAWPTVESVAAIVHRAVAAALPAALSVNEVTVTETENNSASYAISDDGPHV